MKKYNKYPDSPFFVFSVQIKNLIIAAILLVLIAGFPSDNAKAESITLLVCLHEAIAHNPLLTEAKLRVMAGD